MGSDLIQKRLEPLGAISSDLDESAGQSDNENEVLHSSLLTLTTHFARVQLRIKQIIHAPLEDKEQLLRDLDKFAFGEATDPELCYEDELFPPLIQKNRECRKEEKILVKKLKTQVKRLRDYSPEYNNGESYKKMKKELENKSQLEKQLKKQIEDLEEHLNSLKQKPTAKCDCKKSEGDDFLRKIWSFIQMFAYVNFSTYIFPNFYSTNEYKRHWGELRANLELAIFNVKDVLNRKDDVLRAVRSDLSQSISDLIQHGTKPPQNALLSSFCLSAPYSAFTHSWEIILDYYHLKEGEKFNSSIPQKLAKSFNLDLGRDEKRTSKKKLLAAIGDIISLHSPYKRSRDSHFRAFVCAALNNNRLVVWLNLIFQCSDIIQMHYYPWSYVAATRYKDGLKSLSLLTDIQFDLPIDTEVRKFRDVDVFN